MLNLRPDLGWPSSGRFCNLAPMFFSERGMGPPPARSNHFYTFLGRADFLHKIFSRIWNSETYYDTFCWALCAVQNKNMTKFFGFELWWSGWKYRILGENFVKGPENFSIFDFWDGRWFGKNLNKIYSCGLFFAVTFDIFKLSFERDLQTLKFFYCSKMVNFWGGIVSLYENYKKGTSQNRTRDHWNINRIF